MTVIGVIRKQRLVMVTITTVFPSLPPFPFSPLLPSFPLPFNGIFLSLSLSLPSSLRSPTFPSLSPFHIVLSLSPSFPKYSSQTFLFLSLHSSTFFSPPSTYFILFSLSLLLSSFLQNISFQYPFLSLLSLYLSFPSTYILFSHSPLSSFSPNIFSQCLFPSLLPAYSLSLFPHFPSHLSVMR